MYVNSPRHGKTKTLDLYRPFPSIVSSLRASAVTTHCITPFYFNFMQRPGFFFVCGPEHVALPETCNLPCARIFDVRLITGTRQIGALTCVITKVHGKSLTFPCSSGSHTAKRYVLCVPSMWHTAKRLHVRSACHGVRPGDGHQRPLSFAMCHEVGIFFISCKFGVIKLLSCILCKCL